MPRIPVILDTDIGGDIDDTWALIMLLNSPELDVRLITTTTGDTTLRAKVVAKLLEVAGRTDIPIGIGRRGPDQPTEQAPWVADFDLDKCKGTVHADSHKAIIETIEAGRELVTVIAIGPVPDLGAIVRQRPDVARKARFVGMHGSIYRGYDGKDEVQPEYNVRRYPAACRAVFEAPWFDKAITPLDTCGRVRLTGQKYAKVAAAAQAGRALPKALMENYRIWLAAGGKASDDGRSSILFDCVAVYMAYSRESLQMKRLGIRVAEDGMTIPDAAGPELDVAVEWKDLAAFEDHLVERIIK